MDFDPNKEAAAVAAADISFETKLEAYRIGFADGLAHVLAHCVLDDADVERLEEWLEERA